MLSSHDLDNLNIRFEHSFTGQSTQIGNAVVNVVADDALTLSDAQIVDGQ